LRPVFDWKIGKNSKKVGAVPQRNRAYSFYFWTKVGFIIFARTKLEVLFGPFSFKKKDESL
jgi:hypothetical protein